MRFTMEQIVHAVGRLPDPTTANANDGTVETIDHVQHPVKGGSGGAVHVVPPGPTLEFRLENKAWAGVFEVELLEGEQVADFNINDRHARCTRVTEEGAADSAPVLVEVVAT